MTVYEQTGWRGRGPKELCQDIKVLVRITEFDYDLDDDGFYEYSIRRGVIDWRGPDLNPDAIRATWSAEATRAPEWAASTRGKLQAAWELYRSFGHIMNQSR